MEDCSDTSWTWPFWKFGLKKDDLFGSLHERYNTVPSPILDPQAFHHDVYEISHQARNADEFHRLLQARKQQRLHELNETLESAALEIIGNPSLIGTDQWVHAVQLFRTKSLDSLVRYYASYLPPDHPWYKSDSASRSDAGSSVASVTDSRGTTLFDEGPLVDEPLEEPFDDENPSYPEQQEEALIASPRSMTMCSDSSAASPAGDAPHDFDYASPPARSMSFSESEPDCCAMPDSHPCCCRSADATSHATADKGVQCDADDDDDDAQQDADSEDGQAEACKDSTATTLSSPPTDTSDSSIPTSQPDSRVASFFADAKSSLEHHRRHRSASPERRHPLVNCDIDQAIVAHRESRKHRVQLGRRGRARSPADGRRSRSIASARIRKPQPEPARSRLWRRNLVDS
ncbi:hypothetical protein VTJ83DRAFT_140 [Remersonia thermophila]|uniref:Uncharacterized protein n=1 Tax=Remersonia thermophila TaxID=72144 RepID=A0ABR4DL64_9PEZI